MLRRRSTNQHIIRKATLVVALVAATAIVDGPAVGAASCPDVDPPVGMVDGPLDVGWLREGPAGLSSLEQVAPTADGGFAVVGQLPTDIGLPQQHVLRAYGPDGDVDWTVELQGRLAAEDLLLAPDGDLVLVSNYQQSLAVPAVGLVWSADGGAARHVGVLRFRSDGTFRSSWRASGAPDLGIGAATLTATGDVVVAGGASLGASGPLHLHDPDWPPFTFPLVSVGFAIRVTPTGDVAEVHWAEAEWGPVETGLDAHSGDANLTSISVDAAGTTLVGTSTDPLTLDDAAVESQVAVSGVGPDFVLRQSGTGSWMRRFTGTSETWTAAMPSGEAIVVTPPSPQLAAAFPGMPMEGWVIVRIGADGAVRSFASVQLDEMPGPGQVAMARNGDLVVVGRGAPGGGVLDGDTWAPFEPERTWASFPVVVALRPDGTPRWTATISPLSDDPACGWGAALDLRMTADGSLTVGLDVPFGAAIEGAQALGRHPVLRAVVPGWIEPGAFFDVGPGHPFLADISWMEAIGLTTGYWDGTFRPAGNVSRQALVAFLWRLSGSPTGAPAPGFVDVDAEHPFRDAIAWAADAGIVQGYADGTFRPSATISRQALAAILWRVAGEPAAGPASFSDVPAAHPFAPAITWMATTGVSSGYPDGTFRPGAPVSRQAVAAFLHRAVDDGLLGAPTP